MRSAATTCSASAAAASAALSYLCKITGHSPVSPVRWTIRRALPNVGYMASVAPVHQTVVAVTQRILERSRATRSDYLERMRTAHHEGTERSRHGCANLAHGFAAAGPDKDALRSKPWPNIAIVSSYNDMLSAHPTV